jgi:hypothetical protein
MAIKKKKKREEGLKVTNHEIPRSGGLREQNTLLGKQK